MCAPNWGTGLFSTGFPQTRDRGQAIQRYNAVSVAPREVTLEVNPRARVDVIDIRARASEVLGPALENYSRCLYVSAHTTAGFLPQPLAARLTARDDGLTSYLELFRAMFPEGAG